MGPIRKGILLAGGHGSRLYPMTRGVNKHLLPVHDKPMLYYPLTILMLAGITDILLVTAAEHRSAFERLLGDGSQWNLRIRTAAQDRPGGLPEAFLVGADFIAGEPVALILGDNLFYGQGLSKMLSWRASTTDAATIFTFRVADPGRYGLLYRTPAGRPEAIVEKPAEPRSDEAVTGLYLFRADVTELARGLRPSARGELEITDIIRPFLADGTLAVETLGRGTVWFDTGTPHALNQATTFVEIVQTRQNFGIGFPEEVAWRLGLIDAARLAELVAGMPPGGYRAYLEGLTRGR